MEVEILVKVSERKIEANRRNALKSTGPKTVEGKSRSRWNALKHGLLAKAVIIERGEGQERREDFDALLQALQEDLAPEGALEHTLVEKIAVDYSRIRRLLASETGRIRAQLDNLEADECRRIRGEYSWRSPFEDGRHPGVVGLERDRFASALELVDRGLAGEVEASVAMEKALYITEWGGYEEDDDGSDLLEDQAEDSYARENGWTLESLREEIQGRLAELKRELAAANERYELLIDAKRLAVQMPPLDDLELYVRYESMLERQLHRDVELLANVQRMRLLGPVGYRPVRALNAEEGGAPSGDGAEAKS